MKMFKQRENKSNAPRKLLALAVIALLASGNAIRLSGVFAQDSAQSSLAVTASFAGKSNVLPDEAIEIELSRALDPSEGRVAIFVGSSDLTSLFAISSNKLTYNPKILLLPLGQFVLTLYLVSPDDKWKELAGFPIKVSNEKPAPAEEKKSEPQSENKNEQAGNDQGQIQTATKKLGFEKLDFLPSITLAVKSQPAQTNFPADPRPERIAFTDLNMTGSFRAEMARSFFNLQTQFDFAGSSFQKEALRFGELGDSAPQVDISTYLMQYQFGKARYLLGHTSYGASRHLVNSFSSRGMTLTIPFNTRFDFSLAAMNGTSIVGYGNFFGISKRRHQLVAGTLGVEFLPKRPGGLRFETSVMQGWFQPVNGFNQGSVNDSERSKGIGFRLLGVDASQRLRLETGFTRSQFFNPADALLSQGQATIDVRPLWRNALYIDASYDLLKDVAITKEKKLNLTVGFRHERVDPLFKSLGASTQADKIQNEFLVNASLDQVTVQYAHQRFNDNLAGIPSILKSNTRLHTFNIALPLATLFGKPDKPARLLPTTSYNFNRIYQFGAAIPINGGFELDLASIPDQISTNQGLTADWQFEKWRVGYRLNRSFQNNRQTGNELADLSNLTSGFTVGISPVAALDLNLDFNADSARDRLARAVNRNLTLGPNITWRMNQNMSIASTMSFAFAGDAAETKRNRNASFDIQYSYQFAREKDRWRKVAGQFNIRYSNQYSRARDFIFGLNDLRKNQTVFMQISFTFF